MNYKILILIFTIFNSVVFYSQNKKIELLENKIDSLTVLINSLTKDSDNDGISDYFDKENNTKNGARIDGSGVSLDVDLDGIIDLNDHCVVIPGTQELRGCYNFNIGVPVELLEFPDKIEFDYFQVKLTNQIKNLLNKLAYVIDTYGSNLSFYINSYSNDFESKLRNEELAKERAENVLKYLMENTQDFKNQFKGIKIITERIEYDNGIKSNRHIPNYVELSVSE